MPNFIRLSLAALAICALLAGSIRAADYPLGDFDKDGRVCAQDLLVFARYWLDEVCSSPECEADLDGAGGVDEADFALFAQNWLVGPLVINEFMASNNSTLEDPAEPGESADWIELYNPGKAPGPGQ